MIEIRTYAKPDGVEPFTEWLRKLRDPQVRARVRLARLQNGNLGDCKALGGGIS